MERGVWLKVVSWYGEVRVTEHIVTDASLTDVGSYYHPDVIIRVSARLADVAGGREAINNALCAHIADMGYKASLLSFRKRAKRKPKQVDERQKKLL